MDARLPVRFRISPRRRDRGRRAFLFGSGLTLASAGIAGAFPFGDPSDYEDREFDPGEAGPADPPRELLDYLSGKRVETRTIRRTVFIDRPGVHDFRNVVHIARFPGGGCDQTEGRPPALHVRRSSATVRNWICVGVGHDGIHVHSGPGQGWKARGTLDDVRVERCWQQACEDAMTIGFRTRRVRIQRCGFLPNPEGEHRDKLLQLNHADELMIERCYFGPTKNGIEFKSGADFRVLDSVFDHCNTGLRVDTADRYGGIRPDRPTKVLTRGCRFVSNRRAGALSGTVVWRSEGDDFDGCRRKDERERGARFDER